VHKGFCNCWYENFNHPYPLSFTNIEASFLLTNCLAGSEEKLEACKNLGADVCINYKTEDFVARIKEETGGKGIFPVLPIFSCISIGGSLLATNHIQLT
jgi:Zinc-binding dehydrogenase